MQLRVALLFLSQPRVQELDKANTSRVAGDARGSVAPPEAAHFARQTRNANAVECAGPVLREQSRRSGIDPVPSKL